MFIRTDMNDKDFDKLFEEHNEGYSARLVSELLYNNDDIIYKNIKLYFGFDDKHNDNYYITLFPPAPFNDEGFYIVVNSFYGGEPVIEECFDSGNKAIEFISKFLIKYKKKITKSSKDLFFIDIDSFNEDLKLDFRSWRK